MEARLVARAAAATSLIAETVGLQVDEVVVVQNSNRLGLRLLPCDTFARIALVGQEVAGFEVSVAESLAAVGAPVALLDPRVAPDVYELDGFAVTFWSYYPPLIDRDSPADYADALHRLHVGMRSIAVEAPHATQRVAEAEHLLTHPRETPGLADEDRRLLLGTLCTAGEAISRNVDADQLLHGEPHSGNLLGTRDGLLFIDFETCCRGPIEFDVAHAPDDVSMHYPTTFCSKTVVGSSSRWSLLGAGMCGISFRMGVGTPSTFWACSEPGHPGTRWVHSPPSRPSARTCPVRRSLLRGFAAIRLVLLGARIRR